MIDGILDDEHEVVEVLMMTGAVRGIVEDDKESFDHGMNVRKANK